MAEQPGGEATEAPTPKKLADAAKKGDLLQSRELGVALGLAALAAASWAIGGWAIDGAGAVMRAGLMFDRDAIAAVGTPSGRDRLTALLAPLAAPVGILAALTMAAGIAGPAMLGTLGWRGAAMAPKASRMNPVAGLKRMFGAQAGVELVKSIAKVVVLGWIMGTVLVPAIPALAGAGLADPTAAGALIGGLVVDLILWTAGGMAMIALIDVPVARMRRIKRLRMSLQAIRDEHKETEGSPEKKAAIRAAQHGVLSRSARAGVAGASVVLTNPEHFAVALRYRPGVDAVPVVVASGVDALAFAIGRLARDHGVAVLPTPPLARAIYYTTRPGQPIDERLYRAVATVLAFVMRVGGGASGGAGALPDIVLPPDLRLGVDGRPEAEGPGVAA